VKDRIRIAEALRRRDSPVHVAILLVGFIALIAWETGRIWASPIHGTPAWTTGIVIGGATGISATIAWIWRALQPNFTDRGWEPWQFASIFALNIAFIATHFANSHTRHMAPISTVFTVGALSYVIASLGGLSAVMCLVLGPRRMRTESPDYPQEGTNVAHRKPRLNDRQRRRLRS
jgi:hypothetical protein